MCGGSYVLHRWHCWRVQRTWPLVYWPYIKCYSNIGKKLNWHKAAKIVRAEKKSPPQDFTWGTLLWVVVQNSILQLQVNQPKGELTQVTSVKQGQPGLQQDKRFLLQATACQNTAQLVQSIYGFVFINFHNSVI